MTEAPAKKVLIIGIDGGTWDVLGQAGQRDWMPNLETFRRQGCWGTLKSTQPPITPAAWVSFMTGQNPGRHGVLGFQQYNAAANQVVLTSSRSIQTETLWQKLARHGKRVVVVGVPMTYPPLEVNGILVSGFDTPSIDNNFTFPDTFKKKIMELCPDFTFQRRYRTRQLKSPEVFADYIAWLNRQAEQMVQILTEAMTEGTWDLSMVLLRSFDELLHHFWKLLDFSFDTDSDPRQKYMEKYFRDLDNIIGRLVQIGRDNQALVMVISDHGGQAKLGHVYPNRILRRLGYLRTVSPGKLMLSQVVGKLSRDRKRNHLLAKRFEKNIMAQQINFRATRAYVSDINIYADLYLNIKGRQPSGVVTADQSDMLIGEIIRDLSDMTDDAGKTYFDLAEQPRRIYDLESVPDYFPDLIIAPREGYLMRTDITGRELIVQADRKSLSGTHSLNGMVGALGPGVVSARQIKAEIIDIAPTILAAMNLPVTRDMDGKVLTDLFIEPPRVGFEKPQIHTKNDDYAYSRDEKIELSSRLSDLGYL